jgi:hypothetical protein
MSHLDDELRFSEVGGPRARLEAERLEARVVVLVPRLRIPEEPPARGFRVQGGGCAFRIPGSGFRIPGPS